MAKKTPRINKVIRSKIVIIAVLTVFVVGGVAMLIASHAATPSLSVEPENGSLRSPATSLADSTASGSRAIKFTGATPTPSPTPTGTCVTGAKNAPGTADPWGGCWPGPNNTGVPAGTVVKATIPDTLSSGTGWSWVWYTPSKHSDGGYVNIDKCTSGQPIRFDSMLINGTVWIQGGKNTGSHSKDNPCVVITKTKIFGIVYTDFTEDGPIVISDSTVDSGFGKEQFPNVGAYNIYANRVDSYHGEGVIKCQGWCETKDNWVHDMVVEPASHANAIGTNGLYSPAGEKWVIEHNYASCGDWAGGDGADSGGCSGDISLFPNFANIHDVYVHRNYLTAARAYIGSPGTSISNTFHYWSQPAYCIYTGNDNDSNQYRAQNVTIDDNVFGKGISGKCGVYGPVANWAGAVRGNTFTNNKYDDGSAVPSN